MEINREYLGSFQNKLVSSFSKWVPKYILFLAKLKGEVRPFGMENSLDLSHELSLTCGGNVNYHKSVHQPIPTGENRGNSGNFQNESVSSAILLSKMKSLFFSLQTKIFRKHKSVFLQILHQFSVPSNIIPLYFL